MIATDHELEEVIALVRKEDPSGTLTAVMGAVLVDEIDRLRAELASYAVRPMHVIETEAAVDAPTKARSKKEQAAADAKVRQILGQGLRTRAALLAYPHKLRAAAAHARVSPQMMRRFLEGLPVSGEAVSSIEASLRTLDLGGAP